MKGGVNNFIDRSCSRKKKYKNEWDAMYAAEKYGLEVYHCNICSFWHCTKKKIRQTMGKRLFRR